MGRTTKKTGLGAGMASETVEHHAPSAQAAVDLFAGRWVSDLSRVAGVANTGAADLFENDPRPGWAAEAFGQDGRLEQMRILELGPLEGGHSFQLERMGARQVLAIEADADAYLRCLVVKEVVGLQRCRFVLGDALTYLRSTQERFDMIFCSGLLYEVADPVSLIQACCRVSNRAFVWTHYHDPAHPGGDGGRVAREVVIDGFAGTYHEVPGAGQAWMTRADMLACFRRNGLDEIRTFGDWPEHPAGGAISFSASRRWSERFVRLTAPD